MNCKNCKYWDKESDIHEYLRSCLNEKIGNSWTGKDGAECTDNLCGLITGPNFGCIHFDHSSAVHATTSEA